MPRRAPRLPACVVLAVATLALAGCAAASAPPDGAAAAARVLVAVREESLPPESPARPGLAAAPLPAAQSTSSPVASPAPLAGPAALPGAIDLPILMYHRVQEVPAGSTDVVLQNLSVPPRAFREQVDLLTQLGVEAATMDDVLDYLYARRPVPRRAVALTFDDGYDNTYTQAFPILRAAGLRATVYVITGLVGSPGYLTWDQLRELAGQGWNVQSHSATHPDLRALAPAELQRQLRESRTAIERELGRPVSHLAYPAGLYDQRVVDAAALAGYRTAVTVTYGTRLVRRQLFELPRVRVNGQDDAEALRARLRPANWR